MNTEEGSPFCSVFKYVRLQYIINDLASARILERDNILPPGKGQFCLTGCLVPISEAKLMDFDIILHVALENLVQDSTVGDAIRLQNLHTVSSVDFLYSVKKSDFP